jgi:hypothetical protein
MDIGIAIAGMKTTLKFLRKRNIVKITKKPAVNSVS